MLVAFVAGALAIANPQTADSLIGAWHGESKCVGDNPACHDEMVRYVIKRTGDADAPISIAADRFTNGAWVDMGTLTCQADAAATTATCKLPWGIWRFHAGAGTLDGAAIHTDGSQVRKATARRG